MIDATSSPTALPTPGTRRRRRPRSRVFAIAAALTGSVLAPGSAAAASGGAPALPARTVQERLVVLGRLPAAADRGRYARRPRVAVARFPAARGLPVDGVPGVSTADALLAATD